MPDHVEIDLPDLWITGRKLPDQFVPRLLVREWTHEGYYAELHHLLAGLQVRRGRSRDSQRDFTLLGSGVLLRLYRLNFRRLER